MYKGLTFWKQCAEIAEIQRASFSPDRAGDIAAVAAEQLLVLRQQRTTKLSHAQRGGGARTSFLFLTNKLPLADEQASFVCQASGLSTHLPFNRCHCMLSTIQNYDTLRIILDACSSS